MYNTKHWLIGPSEEERIKYTSIFLWQILFVLTAETYPSMDQNNEDKQLFWHWRFLYTYGCLYSLVGYMGRLTLSCIRHFNRIKLQWHWSWPPEFKARCSDHDFYKYQTPDFYMKLCLSIIIILHIDKWWHKVLSTLIN